MEKVFNDIVLERQRQNEKWGEQNHNTVEWIAILTEEVGEAAKEAVDYHFKNNIPNQKESCHFNEDRDIQHFTLVRLRKELIEVAAVAVQIVECLDKKYFE